MLKKGYRIRKQKEFDLIYSHSKKLPSENFQMRIHFLRDEDKNPLMKYPRFAFIVSPKVGKAVVRNRVKRLLRETVRLELSKLRTDFEAIVIAYPQIVEKDFHALESEIARLFSTYNLYK